MKKLLKSERARIAVKIILLLLIVSAILQWALPAVTSEKFQAYVKKLGIFAPLIIIFYTVISHVFAPVSGSPGVFLGFAVFGIIKTSIFLYIGSLISATICFFIARRFGREWVIKLAGKSTMHEVDEFVAASGRKVLAVARVFGFPIYEVISYAVGLTNMSFKDYFIITAIFSAIPTIFFAVVFRDIDFTKPTNMLLWVGSLFIIGIVFTLLLKRSYKKSGKQKI